MNYALDRVFISPRIRNTWMASLDSMSGQLLVQFPDLDPTKEIGDEQFRVLPDGTGEIFVPVRDKELKMKVPKGEFEII